MPAEPVGAAGEKFSKFDTFSCIFRVKNDKFCVFSLKIEKFSLYKLKRMAPAVPIGAAGEKFFKFDAFLRHFFAFLHRFGGGTFPLPPPSLRHWATGHTSFVSSPGVPFLEIRKL